MTEGDGQLEARLAEQEVFEPPESFVEQANVSDSGVYDEFEENWPECWEGAADLLDWESDYDQVLDDSNPPFYEWFTGGELNASANCLDRHLDDPAATRSPSSGSVSPSTRTTGRTPTRSCTAR